MRAGGARLMGRCCALLCFQGCGDYFVRGRVRWVRLVVCPSWRSVKRAVACAKLWVFRGWRWLVGSPCIPRWLRTFPRSSVGLLSFRLWGSRPFGRPLYSRGLVAHTSWSATFPALGFLVRCERVEKVCFVFAFEKHAITIKNHSTTIKNTKEEGKKQLNCNWFWIFFLHPY